MSKCFLFTDNFSGGNKKTQYDKIFIETGTREEAIEIFQEEFGIDPLLYSCSCCGVDFLIDEFLNLDEATINDRAKIFIIERGCLKPEEHGKFIDPSEIIPQGYYLAWNDRTEYISSEEYKKRNKDKTIFLK